MTPAELVTLIGALGTLFALLLGVINSINGASKDSLEQLRKNFEDQKEIIEQLQKDNQILRADMAALKKENEELKALNATLVEENENMRGCIQVYERKFARQEGQIKALQGEIKLLKENTSNP